MFDVPSMKDASPKDNSQNTARLMKAEPFPLYRNLLEDFVRLSAGKHNFHILTSYDISAFSDFSKRCRSERKRPPSLVAYVARCLAVVLAKNSAFTSARQGNTLWTHDGVNIVLTVAAKTDRGETLPLLLQIDETQSKTLAQIADELTTRARRLKRNPIKTGRALKAAAWFARRPLWFRRGAYFLGGRLPVANRHMTRFQANVGLTSTAEFAQGRGGWGVPIFLPFSISLALGGTSRRAVVVGNEIVARECLDVTLTFDHIISDGAPATQLAAILGEEIESGRLLQEFDLSPTQTATRPT